VAGRRFSLLAAGGWYASDGEDLDLPVVDLGDGATWGGPQEGTDPTSPLGIPPHPVGELTLQGRWGWRDKHIPNAWYDSIYGDPRTRVRDDKSFLDLSWNHAFNPAPSSPCASSRTITNTWSTTSTRIPRPIPGAGIYLCPPAQNDLWGGEARLTHWCGAIS